MLVLFSAKAQASSAAIVLGDPSVEVPISGRADILDDPSGSLDIDDVARSTGFRPGASSAQPPDDAVRWYRFRVVARHAADTAQWYLSTASECNEADLYRPHPDGAYALERFGFSVPYALRRSPEASVAIAFDVRQSQTVFVRLRCERSLQQLTFATAETIENATYRTLLRRLDGSFVALIAVTLGLALVTRSAGFALAASTGTLSFCFINAVYLPQWLPTVALPPLWLVYFIIMGAFVISSVSYYSHFLRLRTDHPRGHRFLIATAIFNLALLFVWQTRPPLAFSDTTIAGEAINEFIYAIFAIVETCLAVVFARRGAKSAWFLAATTAIFPLSCVLGVVLDAASAPEIAVDLCEYWFWLPESLLLTLAVGYRLRRTAEHREAILIERDGLQTLRVQEQQAHIVDIERRNAAFAHFVPTQFLRQLERPDIIDVQLGDHVERDMAILFTDIRGFTSLSERLSPAATFAFLNEYLARVGPLVRSHGGLSTSTSAMRSSRCSPDRPATRSMRRSRCNPKYDV
jgi:hypothetical protein